MEGVYRTSTSSERIRWCLNHFGKEFTKLLLPVRVCWWVLDHFGKEFTKLLLPVRVCWWWLTRSPSEKEFAKLQLFWWESGCCVCCVGSTVKRKKEFAKLLLFSFTAWRRSPCSACKPGVRWSLLKGVLMLLTRSGTVHSSAGFAPDVGVCVNKEHIIFQ